MASSYSEYNITVTRDEALILFDWLARFGDGEPVAAGLSGSAEERVFWGIKGQLERQLVEALDPKYKTVLAEARERVMKR